MLTIFITDLYYDYFKNSQKALYFEQWRHKKSDWDGLTIINYVLNLRSILVQNAQLFEFRDFSPQTYLQRKSANELLSYPIHLTSC